jgi:hypothetical protein
MSLYKVTVTFQGAATLEIEADSPEAVRLEAKELTIADLARASHKTRPSGWHRPL